MQFKVFISREDYGHIIVEAETLEEAREMIDSGEWTDDMYTVKNGGVTIEDIIEL